MKIVDTLFCSIKQSRDAKKVISNFSYLSILQISSYVLPLITYPYLARVLGVSGFGKIALAMSMIVYFTTFIDWGFNFTATRDVAKNRDNSAELNEVYSCVMTSKILLLVISSVILVILTLFVPFFKDNYLIIFFSFSAAIGQTLFPEWLYQGLEKMKVITILNLISKAFFTIAIFIFIKSASDYVLQPLLSGVGSIVISIMSLYHVKKIGILYTPCSLRKIYKTLKGSFDVFINNLVPNLYTSFSVIILGVYHGNISNGYLDGANKFYSIGAQFLNVLSRAFFPFLSRRIGKHSFFARIKLCITLILSVLLFFLAPWLVNTFLDNEFKDAVIPLQILSFSLIFHSVTNIYGTNYLVIIGEANLLRKLTMKISLIGFSIAFPLIYYFDFIGASLTICLSRFLLGISVFFVAKRKMAQTS